MGEPTLLLRLTRRSSSTSAQAECATLFGIVSSTCFVLPGTKPGPVCDAASSADSNAAYNNIPKDADDCSLPSHAFEGTSTKEFGNEVVLGKSGNLQYAEVLFNSYACEDFPFWNNNPCTTNDPGDTFTHTITANIYAASSGPHVPGALLATATQTFRRSRTARRRTRRAGTVVEIPLGLPNAIDRSTACSP